MERCGRLFQQLPHLSRLITFCYPLAHPLVFVFDVSSPLLAKKIEQSLITASVLLLHTRIGQIAARRHPAMDLVSKGLNVVRHL